MRLSRPAAPGRALKNYVSRTPRLSDKNRNIIHARVAPSYAATAACEITGQGSVEPVQLGPTVLRFEAHNRSSTEQS